MYDFLNSPTVIPDGLFNWDVGMLRKIILTVLCASMAASDAFASIAAGSYAREYYRKMCNNPLLQMPGNIDNGLISQKYIFSLIDRWNNGQTKYAGTLTDERVVSAAYLADTMDMLKSSYYCCRAENVFPDALTGVCQSCGSWVRSSNLAQSCFTEGQYRNGTSCATCPDGFVCGAGTAGKKLDIFCTDAGRALFESGCEACRDGYLCPDKQDMPELCGYGYYCAGDVQKKCTDTEPDQNNPNTWGTCTLPNLGFVPKYGPCADVTTVTETQGAKTCWDEGEYLNGTKGCAACGDSDYCPAGTSARVIKLFCTDGGWGLFDAQCQPCHNGYRCPSGQELPSLCGAGNYCINDTTTACTSGELSDGTPVTAQQRCALENLWFEPELDNIPCATEIVTRDPLLPACDGAGTNGNGEYRSKGKCVDCPDGMVCPTGTAGRMLSLQLSCTDAGFGYFNNKCQSCFAGYYCPSDIETPTVCTVGHYCPSGTDAEIACDPIVINGVEYGATDTCPLPGMWFRPKQLVCFDVTVAMKTTNVVQCDAGKYLVGGACVTCDADSECPAGTNGRNIKIN